DDEWIAAESVVENSTAGGGLRGIAGNGAANDRERTGSVGEDAAPVAADIVGNGAVLDQNGGVVGVDPAAIVGRGVVAHRDPGQGDALIGDLDAAAVEEAGHFAVGDGHIGERDRQRAR